MSEQNNKKNNAPGFGGGRGGPNMVGGEKAKNLKGTMKKLFSYMGKYKIAMVFVVLFAIAGTAFSIVGPKILGDATTEIYNGVTSLLSGGDGVDFQALGEILFFLLGLYVISGIFTFTQGYIITNVAQKITYKMRKDISTKINVMPMNYFDTKQTGEILSVVTNDVDTLATSLNQSASQIISSLTLIIGILIMMFSISVQMTIVALLILPISMFLMTFIVKRSQKYFKEQQDFLGNVNGQVEETFSGVNVVQGFNKEDETIKEFEKHNEKLYNSAWKAQFLSGLMQPIMVFIGNVGYVFIAVLGGYLAINGQISVGNIQSFIQYVRNFTQPIMQIAQIFNMLQSMAASAERIFEFLEEEEESQTAENHAKIKDRNVTINDITGKVGFDHVNFGYIKGKTIINDFSAEFDQGKKIAIVGPTGAGKTTIIKLLMRFYDVTNGKITVDGYNIKDFDRRELREVFGMVLQDTWLFSGSIMENIRYGRLDATDEEVINAAKAAHAHSFIKTLPDGYNMVLNEDASNISGGQKQLLTIARTILADPRILILDEATSSVDTRTEVRIQKAMDNIMEGRTSFVIAHRLSTIKDADIILVMKDGDILEMGNHNELLEKKGFYFSLYNSQFENAS